MQGTRLPIRSVPLEIKYSSYLVGSVVRLSILCIFVRFLCSHHATFFNCGVQPQKGMMWEKYGDQPRS